MKYRLIPNWESKNLVCCLCGTTQSVKYETEIADVTVYCCNTCAAKFGGESLGNKYVSSNFGSVKLMKEAIMQDRELSDMEKLRYVFRASKAELKANDPQLYYAILAVLDAAK